MSFLLPISPLFTKRKEARSINAFQANKAGSIRRGYCLFLEDLSSYLASCDKNNDKTQKEAAMKNQSSRRRFLKFSLAGVIGMTLGGKELVKSVQAADLPHLTEDDPQASALKYVHNSPYEDRNCSGCVLLQGNDGDEWRPCQLFPGKLVSATGWCSAWAG